MEKFKGNTRKQIYFCDTENTYKYNGEHVSFSDLEVMQQTDDFDVNLVTVGKVLFGINAIQEDDVNFLTNEGLVDFFNNLSGHNIIYFFNLAYDFSYLGKILYYANFRPGNCLVNQNSPISLEFKRGKDKVTILDIRKMFVGSLKSVGESLGCELAKTDFPIDSVADLEKPETLEYLINDVLLLKEIYIKGLAMIQDVQKRLNLPVSRQLPLTAGSLAKQMAIYKGYPVEKKKNFLKHNPNANFQRVFGYVTPEHDQLFRRFYYGGLGSANMPSHNGTYFKNVGYADVKSMYPFVMSNYPFPTYKDAIGYHGFMPTTSERPFAFYRVKVNDCLIRHDAYPSVVQDRLWKGDVSLVTDLEDGELFLIDYHFGRSDWKNFLNDYITDYEVMETFLLHGVNFSKGFIDYIREIYELKEEHKANKPLSTIFKLLLNSLYGKIGQNMAYQKTVLEWSEDYDKYMLKLSDEVDVNPDSQLSVAIASVITMFARNYLLDMVDAVGTHNVILTATDCVVYLNKGQDSKLKQMIPYSDTTLGSIDIEYMPKFALYGTKNYQYYNSENKLVTKCAGMSNETKNSLPWLWTTVAPDILLKKSKSIPGGRFLKTTTFKFEETPTYVINYQYQKELSYDKET